MTPTSSSKKAKPKSLVKKGSFNSISSAGQCSVASADEHTSQTHVGSSSSNSARGAIDVSGVTAQRTPQLRQQPKASLPQDSLANKGVRGRPKKIINFTAQAADAEQNAQKLLAGPRAALAKMKLSLEGCAGPVFRTQLKKRRQERCLLLMSSTSHAACQSRAGLQGVLLRIILRQILKQVTERLATKPVQHWN